MEAITPLGSRLCARAKLPVTLHDPAVIDVRIKAPKTLPKPKPYMRRSYLAARKEVPPALAGSLLADGARPSQLLLLHLEAVLHLPRRGSRRRIGQPIHRRLQLIPLQLELHIVEVGK